MSELGIAMAKLSGIKKAIEAVMQENVSRNRSQGEIRVRSNYPPDLVQHYFEQAAGHLGTIKALLPDMYGDFQQIATAPETKMASPGPGQPEPMHFSRIQLERLVRDIEQIFEIRANSELAQPKQDAPQRVFVTHGRAQDWRAVQAHIEKDIGLPTMELAQEPSQGRTIIEKLEEGAGKCDGAVIVMTGDDMDAAGQAKVRENVMHEIGYFHGRYGRDRVVLLHEDGVSTPTNLAGVVYVPFPKGSIESAFYVLSRELKAMYKLG